MGVLRGHFGVLTVAGGLGIIGVFSARVHLRTNGTGHPVAVDIKPSQAFDCTGALPLIDVEGPEPKFVPVKRGYRADEIRSAMAARGVTPIIAMWRSREVQLPVDGHIYSLGIGSNTASAGLQNWRRPTT